MINWIKRTENNLMPLIFDTHWGLIIMYLDIRGGEGDHASRETLR